MLTTLKLRIINRWRQIIQPYIIREQAKGDMKLDLSGDLPRIFGYRRYLNKKVTSPKKALLSYLTEPIIHNLLYGKPVQFSNKGIALSIPHALNELGYEVDIVSWTDTEYAPKTPYDLYIQHGGANFNNIYKQLKAPLPVLVYFSTGLYWKTHNDLEEQRFKNFQKKHKVKLPLDRHIDFPEEDANRKADGIIALGSNFAANTFKDFPLVLPINNSAYPVIRNKAEKNYTLARENFLFFSGSGNIHKGLGLLLDVFKSKRQRLYIMTKLDSDFEDYYRHELYELPNIHYVGEVKMRSDQFFEVADKCAFSILPSCSEGQAGSVIETMMHGLIPVVTEEVALEQAEYIFTLKDDEEKTIKEMVNNLAVMEPKKLQDLAEQIILAANTVHSPEYFIEEFKKHIQLIVNKKLERMAVATQQKALVEHSPENFLASFKQAVTSILQKVRRS